MKKIILVAAITVIVFALCACAPASVTNELMNAIEQAGEENGASESGLSALLEEYAEENGLTEEDVSDVLPDSQDMPDDASGDPADIQGEEEYSGPESADEPAAPEEPDIPDDDGFETGAEEPDMYIDLDHIKYIGRAGDMEVFGLQSVVWVSPDDTELIEMFGLEDAYFDDDYELVELGDEYLEYYADPAATAFYVIDYATDLSNREVSCEEFIRILSEDTDSGIILAECTIEGDRLLNVSQVYIP